MPKAYDARPHSHLQAELVQRQLPSSTDAIALIREQRGSSALCNHRFVAWLREVDVREWRA